MRGLGEDDSYAGWKQQKDGTIMSGDKKDSWKAKIKTERGRSWEVRLIDWNDLINQKKKWYEAKYKNELIIFQTR